MVPKMATVMKLWILCFKVLDAPNEILPNMHCMPSTTREKIKCCAIPLVSYHTYVKDNT